MAFKDEITFGRIWVINCARCNENIVERADEVQIVTRADAESYARDHWANEHETTEGGE